MRKAGMPAAIRSASLLKMRMSSSGTAITRAQAARE